MLRCCALLLIVLRPALLAAQDPQHGLIIQSTSRLVQVNVVAHDKKGTVRGLTKEDFVVLDQGVKQEIAHFTIEGSAATGETEGITAKNTFSNQRTDHAAMPANLTVVLLDGLNTRFEDQASSKRHLMKYLAGVDPSSRLAIYALGRTLTVVSDFNDPAQLNLTLARRRGQVNTEVGDSEPAPANTGNPDFDAALDAASAAIASGAIGDRSQITFKAFSAIANHLAALPGRKNLIWITGGSPFSVATLAKAMNNANIAIYPVDARGLVGLPPQLTAGAGSVPTKGRSPAPIAYGPSGVSAMDEIAEQTGGRALYNTNDLSGAIRAAQDDSAVSYTLGYYPDASVLDGRFHEIKIRVNRSGIDLRYRKGYFAATGEDAVPGRQQALDAALWSPLESSAIPLRATVERGANARPGWLKISYSVDVRSLQLEERRGVWQGEINVVFIQQDAAGRVLDTEQEAFDFNIPKEIYEEFLKKRAEFSRDLRPKPGLATLRLAVVSRQNGSAGSLLIPYSQVK
jgi:VWFA-related protein